MSRDNRDLLCGKDRDVNLLKKKSKCNKEYKKVNYSCFLSNNKLFFSLHT